MTHQWNTELIEKIAMKLELGTDEAVLHSEDEALRQGFISEVNLLESETENEEGILEFEKMGELPEQKSENLHLFLEYIGGDEFSNELYDMMELEEFQVDTSMSGFDYLDTHSTVSIYGTYIISYEELASFLNDAELEINDEINSLFVKEAFSS
jgi:hypothetical protein